MSFRPTLPGVEVKKHCTANQCIALACQSRNKWVKHILCLKLKLSERESRISKCNNLQCWFTIVGGSLWPITIGWDGITMTQSFECVIETLGTTMLQLLWPNQTFVWLYNCWKVFKCMESLWMYGKVIYSKYPQISRKYYYLSNVLKFWTYCVPRGGVYRLE